MIIHSIPVSNLNLERAFETALSENAPILIPSAHYVDDRGWSLMNQLQGVMTDTGQINYSTMHPSVVKAWHRHQRQTDFWIPLHGQMKLGVYRESDGTAWEAIAGQDSPCTMIIPPQLWHGVANIGSTAAGLLYYVTHQYDVAQPDEQRCQPDSFAGFPWTHNAIDGNRHGKCSELA